MIADPKSEKTLTRIASALETSFVFKGIEQSVLQQVSAVPSLCMLLEQNTRCAHVASVHCTECLDKVCALRVLACCWTPQCAGTGLELSLGRLGYLATSNGLHACCMSIRLKVPAPFVSYVVQSISQDAIQEAVVIGQPTKQSHLVGSTSATPVSLF